MTRSPTSPPCRRSRACRCSCSRPATRRFAPSPTWWRPPRPQTITYASGGPGSSAHLAAELFARRAGVSLVHVPYRGGGPAVQSLLAGDVQILWDTPQPSTRSHIDEGQLRALAVMGRTRLASYPEIAAIGEAGLGDDLEVQAWQGVLVRSGTPGELIEL